MKKTIMNILLIILLSLSGECVGAEFMSVTVNTYAKRADGTKGRLSERVSTGKGRWKMVVQDAVVAKESETNTSAVWRVRNLLGTPITTSITFTDQYRQPHSAAFVLEGNSGAMQLSLPRMVNTVLVTSGRDVVEAEVWFEKRGRKNAMSAENRCLGNKKEGYDYPTIWQGNAAEYSVYIKPRGGDVREINLAGKLFGTWCISQIDIGTPDPEIHTIIATPIPGLLKISSSAH